jgi:4-amino-4-deoxy-L-arabinose transferase-like glycosyltransferase
MTPADRAMKRHHFYLASIWLGSVAACLLIDIFFFPNALTFPDEQRFLASAVRLAQTGEFWVGNDRAWEMPGTAIFFAIPIDVLGADAALLAIRLLQAMLLVVQSGLIYLTARRVFGDRRAGLVAATIAAFYPFFLYYQGLLLSETLFNTLLIAGFASIYWWRERGLQFDRAFVAAILCFAVAAMVKASMTVLPPVLLAVTALHGPQKFRHALKILVVSALLYASLLSPWWIRNFSIFGAFVPFATGSGVNLYVGNNPGNPNGDIDWETLVEPEVFKRIGAIADERERDRAFIAAAVSFIKQDPTGFVVRAGKKFVRFWNVVPNAQAFNRGFYRIVSAASYGPVLFLAILSVLRWRRDWVLLAPMALLIAYLTLIHMITIASLRYRLPLEPLLIVLAAGPISAMVRRLCLRSGQS